MGSSSDLQIEFYGYFVELPSSKEVMQNDNDVKSKLSAVKSIGDRFIEVGGSQDSSKQIVVNIDLEWLSGSS